MNDDISNGAQRNVPRYLIAIAFTALLWAVMYLTFFRYQYVNSGNRTDRVDRLTGRDVRYALPARDS